MDIPKLPAGLRGRVIFGKGMIMSDLISKQVLDLWNRYKPTIAVDAIEYDRELKKLLSTNLAEVGTDCISRRAAIDGLRDYLVGKRCPDDGTLTCRLIENEVINKLPPAEPKRGKWIKLDMHRGMADHKCTACEQECYVPTCMGEPMYAFCPNCGAKMEVTT